MTDTLDSVRQTLKDSGYKSEHFTTFFTMGRVHQRHSQFTLSLEFYGSRHRSVYRSRVIYSLFL